MNKSISRARLIRAVLAGALLVPLLFALGGCWLLYNEAPTAALTASPPSGQAPLTVNFGGTLSEDPDGDIEKFEWDFGDGTSGSGENVTHTYTAGGTFTAVLRVTDDDGETATNNKTIYVSPAEPPGPTASFTASPTSGTSPLTVYADASTSTYDAGVISQYVWNWGDGATGYGRTASHTYFSTGSRTYTITLTVTGTDSKTGTATKSISLSVAGDGTTPTAGDPSARFDIDFDDHTQTASAVVVYSNHDVAPLRAWFDPSDTEPDDGRVITAYIWSFADGSTQSTISPTIINHTFITDEESEVFSVTLIVTDDGNPAGSDSISKTVRVENYTPTAGFEVADDLDDATGAGVTAWWTGLNSEDGDGDDDRVTYYSVPLGVHTVWIRSQEIVDPAWLNKDNVDPDPNGENEEPGEFEDDNGNNMCFDPEGQTWIGGVKPAWFPNDAWGIQYLRVNWGDGNIENVPFEDSADTYAGHDYNFDSGPVKSWTITVTAVDFLGAESSFSRLITFNQGP
ncbi:PKD domain-containing protein [Candidatus Bipolaricaulota bacterium]